MPSPSEATASIVTVGALVNVRTADLICRKNDVRGFKRLPH